MSEQPTKKASIMPEISEDVNDIYVLLDMMPDAEEDDETPRMPLMIPFRSRSALDSYIAKYTTDVRLLPVKQQPRDLPQLWPANSLSMCEGTCWFYVNHDVNGVKEEDESDEDDETSDVGVAVEDIMFYVLKINLGFTLQ